METFEQLVKQYEAMIYKIMHTLHIYKNEEEFYQVGLIALWEAWLNYDERKGHRFISYAYSFVRGRLLNELTRMNKYIERNVHAKDDFWLMLIDQTTDSSLDHMTLYSYCDSLTERQSKWVVYTFLFDLSIAEIALLENVSIAAVKQWRQGARERLKRKLLPILNQ
ncbi:sigma-70 family RNA polymerase sigma factor [Cytobacillus purgationiresistens]|uniref:DNA-directed RNA polymerase n=1 Tax=Cytobacillus purgationiresistens TaxID=863449 RepID=A0ABU0AD18_9BACI|nr:sigma-70 family RNA polymerase sigma factor [Cytobacillus purgationiresistens]MDQ0269138.1 DNA-directed RNA polymerase [Cytobacillus purgationiresistens]